MSAERQQLTETGSIGFNCFEGKSVFREEECVFKKCCKKYKKPGKRHCKKCPKF